VGTRDHLLSLDEPVQGLAREFLMDSWLPEEVLVRLSLALSQRPKEAQAAGALLQSSAAVQGRAQIVVADDDSTVLLLVRTALQNFGMDCQSAADGPQALEMIRRIRPHAAVLDVNMPGMDGYAVLAAIRQEGIPLRVLLLTARQQESDIIRGFNLGADDYVVKPFSPMELVARLKRLLGR
jgi:CheY-like chemotaxis protein